ncbi:NUDIX hydrolase [Micromonospora mangrovi]|uniref:NUDIX hydrolase n=2 Tax=Micromonospora TaxID=1873 RepID=A0AAU7M981_9ACTN
MPSDDAASRSRRDRRLARYDQLRAERPHLFANPPGAAYEIVFDRELQNRVADGAAAALRAAGKPTDYGDVGVIYEDRYVIIVRDAVRFLSGDLGPYIRSVPAVLGVGAAVLPVFADGRMLLVRHFRHELRTWQWEVPRGFAEPDADGAATAGRELEEEVGLSVEKVELLGRVASDGGADEIYLARLQASGPPDEIPLDAVREGIDERRLVTRQDLAAMIASGEVTDHYLLAAFAFATAKGLL